jgi:hypothetical protein
MACIAGIGGEVMRHMLTLDLSSKTGWARWQDGMDAPASGVRVFEVAGKVGTRYREARQWMQRTIQSAGVEVVVKEGSAGPMLGTTNASATEFLAYMHGMVAEVCSTLDVDLVDMPIPTWRSLALGTSRVPKHIPKDRRRSWWKRQAIARCDELGWPVRSDDEAEALLIAHAYRLRTDRTYAVNTTPLLSLAGL